MALITWYTIAKKIGDNTQIDTEIDNKIATHNEDVNSHDESIQSIGVHKISDPITHQGTLRLATHSAANAYVGTIFYASNYGKACYKDWYGQVFQLY